MLLNLIPTELELEMLLAYSSELNNQFKLTRNLDTQTLNFCNMVFPFFSYSYVVLFFKQITKETIIC